MAIEYTGPNIEQIKYWNEISAAKWIALQPMLDAQLGQLGKLTMDRAGVIRGQQVLDVGCGCGSTTIEIARRGSSLPADRSEWSTVYVRLERHT